MDIATIVWIVKENVESVLWQKVDEGKKFFQNHLQSKVFREFISAKGGHEIVKTRGRKKHLSATHFG